MRPLRFLPLNVVASVLLCSAAAMAQQFTPAVRIVDRIDESQLVTLRGNTHPAANAKNDQGLVSPNLPMTDLILVLSRDPAQQAAFNKFVESQYDPNSPNFHQWLTPEQVGTNFGPSETDIATITNWLTGHGFAVSQVTKDHMSIRFSGTAGQVQSTFHTEIHNLSVKGVAHIGNMSDPQIPAALGSVVVGVKALHNFFPRPLHRMGSQVTKDSATGKWQRNANSLTIASKQSGVVKPATATAGSKTPRPQFTINVPASGGAAGTPAYTEEDLSPYDFATIYDVLPLWNKGIDGTGQTIAIAGTSDISQTDISNFRTFFDLPTNIPANTPKIVHPNPSLPGGDDPGICTSTTSTVCSIDDLVENSLDVEWSGSVAKNAQIVLVTAASQSSSDDTLYDAESYIVDNVTAHIVSVSYGNCELFMGTSGNAEYNTLWQNAASEGIAVFVAAGDSGSASCDDSLSTGAPWVAEDGLSVSGLASTPYDTAVGGTDFNWCPYLTAFNGNACPAQPYWASSNTVPPPGGINASISALGYVPEMPWNETCTNPFMLQGLITLAGPNYLDVSGVSNTEEACNLIADNLDELEADYPYSVGLINTVGGGGGASGCTTSDGSDVSSCAGGYAKPSWQAGVAGIPSDGKRDLPDVSFFAADGYVSDSAYLICVEENGGQPCTYSADAEPFASEVGGTSASTPPMAGVMALIDQKMGAAQGFANPELYKLAGQQTYSSCSAETVTASGSCMFNDIDAGPFASPGTIAMPCDSGANFLLVSPNCVVKDSLEGFSDEVGILSTSTGPGYNAGTGYDLATGLGSLNVANVVNAWTAVTGLLTPTVTVTPSPTTLPTSQSLSVTGTVTGTGATPTGTVTLTAGTYTSPATALSSTGTFSFTVPAGSLSAGTDTLSVAYSGNSTYNPANGTATVTVTATGTAASFSLITPAIVVTPAGGVAPGASANAAVTVSAVNGYAGTVELTCSELSSTSPSNSASDAPSCTGGGPGLTVTLPSGTTQVVNFTVTTTAPSTTTIGLAKPALGGKYSGWAGAGGGAVLAFLMFLGIPARRRSWRSMVGMLVVMVALGGLSSCGTGGGGTGTTTNTDPGTSAGTYTFTVTGVGNPSVNPTSSTSTTFTVTVN